MVGLSVNYLEDLRQGLREILEENPDVFLIGEDIQEPYGGAFKVTKGLSTQFPKQVLFTPMSEQGFTAMALGMAMTGLKPIVEIMFGDFITLCTDVLINHLSKFQWLFNQKIPFILRTPMGGYRSYGATHSQSLEKLFFSIPNIKIIAPSILDSPGQLLKTCVKKAEAILFIENKSDYGRKLIRCTEKVNEYIISQNENEFPIWNILVKESETPKLAIITYGGLASLALEVQWEIFMEEEISTQVIVLSQISPLPVEEIVETLTKAGLNNSDSCVLILEEGIQPGGWGNAVLSGLYQKDYYGRIKTLGSLPLAIGATSSLEEYVLPTKQKILRELGFYG